MLVCQSCQEPSSTVEFNAFSGDLECSSCSLLTTASSYRIYADRAHALAQATEHAITDMRKHHCVGLSCLVCIKMDDLREVSAKLLGISGQFLTSARAITLLQHQAVA